jgi:hypothetical protein
MDDLISRAAAVRALASSNGDYLDAWERIEKIPAVDAAPVVRCRDCKYGEPDTNGLGEDMVMCQNKLNPIGDGDWLMPPEFFCADGERRDDDGKDA